MIDPLFYNPFHKCWNRDRRGTSHAPFHEMERFSITNHPDNGWTFDRRRCRKCGYIEPMCWQERWERIKHLFGIHTLVSVHGGKPNHASWYMCVYCDHTEEA